MIRVLLILTALLFTTSGLDAACDYRLLSSEPFRITAHDVEIDGNEIWIASSYGLIVYDGTTEPPTPATSIALPGPTTEVELASGFIYAASGSNLHVIARSGKDLTLVRTVDAGATIHDMTWLASRLWAATSSGVLPIDLSIPTQPSPGPPLATSNGIALALAVLGDLIYVADGDATIEVISSQGAAGRLGTFASLSRATAISQAGGRLFVSDGIQTEVFANGSTSPARLGTIPWGTVTVVELSGEAVYTAGNDRRIRALDLSSVQAPVILFEAELPASSGTVNRIEALATDGTSLHAAAGDLGLVSFDVREFDRPFPLRHTMPGSYQSSAAAGATLFLARIDGGLESWSVNPEGALTRARQWDGGVSSTIHDASEAPARLLTSSGSTLRLWNVDSEPALHSTVNMRDVIVSAVLEGDGAFAVLADRSLWRVDFKNMAGTAAIVPVSGTPSFVARGGSSLALAELNPDGTTSVRFFPTGDPASSVSAAVIDGSATSGIAISDEGLVVAVTFRGIIVVDSGLGAPSVSVIPGSNRGPARGLSISGNDLFVLGTSTLDVWDLQTRTLRSSFPLPATGTSLSSSGEFAFVAGPDGVTVVNHGDDSMLPVRLAPVTMNAFHETLRVSDRRLFLFGEGLVETSPIRWNGMQGNRQAINVSASTIDIAAAENNFFTLSANGRVSARSLDGNVIAEFVMSEGADATALSLTEAAGALYLSLSRGCLSGACEKKTLILEFDGSAIRQTASLAGELIDLAVNQSRGYAVFEDPDELRILDLTNPAHPAVLASRPSEGDPVAVAYRNGSVYALGLRLYVYSEPGLTRIGELFDDYVPEPGGRLTYRDQSLLIAGRCAIVTGRSLAPQVYAINGAADWELRESPGVPSAVSEVVEMDGMLYLLTGHSLEVWTLGPPPSRRRPAG